MAVECKILNLLEKYPEKTRQLEDYISKYLITGDMDQNRGVLIQCLHAAQDIFDYLPLEVQIFVAKKLRLQQSDVYGVISFYSYFTDKPIGKFKINVCTGTACFVKGAKDILDEFKIQLGIDEGETSQDEQYSLGGLRCVGACSLAPVVMVNDKVYGNVTRQMVTSIIKKCE